jgi:hypothetical protein
MLTTTNHDQAPTRLLPHDLFVEQDDAHPACFKLVNWTGRIWAAGIPTYEGAKVLAAAPRLLGICNLQLTERCDRFWDDWDIPYSVDLPDLAEDDGPLQEAYPGAPEEARWLISIQEVLDRAGAEPGKWPVEDEPEQLQLEI